MYITLLVASALSNSFKMAEVVTCVLKHTFGFLANQIREEVVAHLTDGDVTDEQCRRLIVAELDDIKSKIDGLARKDLLSSFCFLQEGINGLSQCLLQSNPKKDAAKSTSPMKPGLDSPIHEAVHLLNAITSLKISSKERFQSVTESFKLAREKATDAFCNEALCIEDRIQASQIRMIARILEKLEDPDSSVSDCLQYIGQLHSLGAVQETFSVLIDGGVKSLFSKTRRLANASSVQIMNQILFEFAAKFSKLHLTVLDWHTIVFNNKRYNPLLGEDGLVKKLEEYGVHVMSPYHDFKFGDLVNPRHAVTTSRGDIIRLSQDARAFRMFQRSGESYTLCEAPKEGNTPKFLVTALDIDAQDNLYVITRTAETIPKRFQEGDDQSWSFKLFVFDKNGNKMLDSPLHFHQSSSVQGMHIAINKDGRIGILNCEKKTLCLGSINLQQNMFVVEKCLSLSELFIENYLSYSNVRFLESSGLKIVAADKCSVYIYNDDGQLQRNIRMLEGHGRIHSVAINHVTKRLLVKTSQPSGRNLLSFSEGGELLDNLYLGSREWMRHAEVASHPNGPVALVGIRGAALLQL